MTTRAYLTESAAVARSISHNEIAVVALPEDISGVDDRVASVVDALKKLGMEDHTPIGHGAIDAWGTKDGHEWRVRTVDGLTTSVTYVRS